MSFGGMFTAFSGGPKFRVLDKTKSQDIQTRLEALMKDYDTNRTQTDDWLSSFIDSFLAGSGEAQGRATQEIGALDEYYDGTLDAKLGDMRARRRAAVNAAGDQALQYATANRAKSQLLQDGNDKAWNARLALKQGNDVRIQNALADAGQERADFDMTQSGRMNLIGRRQGVQDAIFNRILLPAQLRQQNQSFNLGSLAGIQGINNANKFYGLDRKKSGLEKWGNFLDENLDTISTLAAIYGQVSGMAGGGMGGGGGKGPVKTGSNSAGYGLDVNPATFQQYAGYV